LTTGGGGGSITGEERGGGAICKTSEHDWETMIHTPQMCQKKEDHEVKGKKGGRKKGFWGGGTETVRYKTDQGL